MSRRGNSHDNTVAESFFQLLNQERIRRHGYPSGNTATQDVFEDTEMHYSPKRNHTENFMLSPVDFETRQQRLNEGGVYETRGSSPPAGSSRSCEMRNGV